MRHAQAATLAAGVLAAGCASDAATSTGAMSLAGSAGNAAAVSGTGSAAIGGGSGSGGDSTQAAAASAKLSFANDVFPKVIRVKCGSCHNDAPSFGGLAFFPGPEMAYANLVNVPSGDKAGYLCAGSALNRVQPGEPEKSLIYLKLTNPPCGSKMPPAMFGTASPEQIELVRQWIADGAAP